MSGKKKKPGAKKDNRGGARKNAGRKKAVKNYSEDVKNNYIDAAAKLAEEFGVPVEEAMLRMIYDEKVQDTVKASVMKTYNEALLVKSTEQKITTEKVDAPEIYLPKMKDDPATLIPIDGGKDGNRKNSEAGN